MNTLTAQRLKEMQDEGGRIHLLNVLPNKAFQEMHIPGSDNIPVERDDFVKEVELKVADKNKRIVVCCASERCDAFPKAAKKLEAAGFPNVFDYEGGLEDWQRKGLPVEGLIC